MLKVSTAQKPLLVRLFVFCILFIAVSGITGSWVVSTRLLYGFHLFIYGNLGKLVLFSAIVFGLLARKRLADLEKLPKVKTNILYIALSLFLIPVFFFFGSKLLTYQTFSQNLPLSVSTHALLILIPSLLLLGIFGFRFLAAFAGRFTRELSACVGISVVYDIAIFQVWKLWPVFSDGVLHSVRFLLSLTASNVRVLPPRTLVAGDFAVSIGQSCSGLDSLFLFSSLYLLIAILEWKVFNKIKLVAMFICATIGLYIVNIFRVYLLITIGAYVSADLAIKLFHTYLGMVLFIIFFFVFWKFSYKWMTH